MEELNFSTRILDQVENMHLNSTLSDVIIVVDELRVPAHKFILGMRSSYFEALFAGDSMESRKSEIELDVPLEVFKHVLRYFYTGRISYQKMDKSIASTVNRFLHKYGIKDHKSMLPHSMESSSLEDCCHMLNIANYIQLDPQNERKNALANFMDRNAGELLQLDKFMTLTYKSLRSLLERSTFCAPEVDILKAVLKWRKHNPKVQDDEFQTVVSCIRFELIDLKELFSIVEESGILSGTRLLDEIRSKAFAKNLNHRYDCRRDINIATNEFNAKVIQGSNPLELLNGNVVQYDESNGYTNHRISKPDENTSDGIIVQLGKIFMINKLDLLLWDAQNRSYSYYVEVSTDQRQWARVIDHTGHKCRSWQYLYFEPRPVRYIKIVGTGNTFEGQATGMINKQTAVLQHMLSTARGSGNTENETFRVVHLAAYYTESKPTLIDGLISPDFNVAAKQKHARVIKGDCYSNDSVHVMLNGDFINYTLYEGYTFHTMHQSIVVQLAQPYHIGSIRLLLWDKDDRTYSFHIETSTNNHDWTMAVDKRNERLKSWQEFTFTPRPVCFFRITGTIKSGNDCFHLVHFEAPNMNISV